MSLSQRKWRVDETLYFPPFRTRIFPLTAQDSVTSLFNIAPIVTLKMNAATFPRQVLWCKGLLWFAVVGVASAEFPHPFPSVRFQYEGKSELTGSPVFLGPKTDYYWGELKNRDFEARAFHCELYRSDPSNSSAYTAEIRETVVLDATTVFTSLNSLELRLDHTPRSVEDARSILEDGFSATPNEVQKHYYFETVEKPAHYRLLRNYSYLGMTSDGPIWELSEPRPDSVEGKPVFEYNSSDGIAYRFVFDRQLSIFSTCDISLRDTQPPPGKEGQRRAPFEYLGEIVKDDAGILIQTSTSTQAPSTPNRQVVQVTGRLFDFELDCSDPITSVYSPENGDRVDSLGTPQIKFEWKDGKIVKTVNPLANAEGMRFVTSRRWMVVVNIVVIVAIAVAFWMRRKRHLPLVVLAVFLSISNTASGSNSYCGVYSICGAAKAFGIDVDLEELINPQYISSQRGSTTQDLVKAAESVGLEATPLSGLGVSSLKAAEKPLILHTSTMGFHGAYQHWILFLGFDQNGSARVVDGAGGVAHCSLEEVLARWDGIAIAIREPSSGRTRYLSTELAYLCFLVAYGCVFSLVVKSGLLTRRSVTYWWRSDLCIHLMMLLVVSVCVGYTANTRAYRSSAECINSALGLTHWPEIHVEEMVCKMNEGIVLIDCRYEADYELGHIDNAISVPIDVGLGDFTRKLKDIDRDAELVVYCQSPQCSFSKYSATMLAGAGFSNVKLFAGGFVTWESHVDGK